MPTRRSASMPVLTPGATAPDTAGDAEDGDDTIDSELTGAGDPGASDPAAANDSDVLARLAALEAENARLRAAAESKPELPQVLYEPVTPHGAEKLAASPTAHLTVAQVMASIDEGRMKEPTTNLLCRDGWYCSRARREA